MSLLHNDEPPEAGPELTVRVLEFIRRLYDERAGVRSTPPDAPKQIEQHAEHRRSAWTHTGLQCQNRSRPESIEEETMSEAQGTKTAGRPWHLWLIGIIGALWNSMGVISFVLTQMQVEAVMSQFPPQQREYFESFPLWAVAFWAIGVFGGVIGCLLLLLENRLAFHVLLASAIGAIVSTLGGLFLLGGMEVMRETDALGLTIFPIVIDAFLAYYARAMSKKGVLG
jgi:hypothetical protein